MIPKIVLEKEQHLPVLHFLPKIEDDIIFNFDNRGNLVSLEFL